MARFPNAQNNPAGAIPVYVVPGGGGLAITNRSVTQNTGSALVVPANANRRYLFIQCVSPGITIWVNTVGGPAAVEAVGSFQLTAGQTYESGPVVPNGAVHIYVPSNGVKITVMEG